MPKAHEFLNGFGLIPNTMFAGYQLTSATSTHQSIKRYQEYQYQITLVFMGQPNYTETDYRNLFHAVMAKTTQEHIIYGIRNPYRCIIDPPSQGDIVGTLSGPITFNLMGHSYRA
jgi:hypothetical protein